jgi:hypothetical protein
MLCRCAYCLPFPVACCDLLFFCHDPYLLFRLNINRHAVIATVALLLPTPIHPQAEPHLLLAQLALQRQDWDAAESEATEGLRLLATWGTTWDKRMAWEAW